MRNCARIAIVLSVLLMVVLIGPLIIGFYLERNYPSILHVYNTLPQINIDVDHFDRGWFHSTAKLHVQILDPDMLAYIHKRSWVLDQEIQHGPIFYNHLKELPYFIGLASIQNHLSQTEEIAKIIKDIDYVSFRGNYHKYIKLADVNLIYPQTDMHINISKVEGRAWISAKQNIQGDSVLQNMVFHNSDVMILIPHISAQFDNDARLWLGNDNLTIPSISLIENNMTTGSLSDLKYKGSSEVVDGMMNGAKDVSIQQIYIGDYEAGPLRVNLSIKKLNAGVVDDMIEAYHLIMKRGELYESQLVQKMMMMLPDVFNQGTTIALNDFDLKTQDGHFYINGKMVWNMDKEAIPDQIGDVLSVADTQFYLKIAKPLMYRWISIASTLPWFNQTDPDLDKFYQFARYEMIFTTQLNTVGVLQLVDENKLQESDATSLLSLQKENISTSDYAAAVKELLLNKIISRETSYILLYLYTQGQAPIDSIRVLLQRNQEKVAASMSSQLQNWIKSGYIQQQQNDYVVSFVRKDSQTKFNKYQLFH